MPLSRGALGSNLMFFNTKPMVCKPSVFFCPEHSPGIEAKYTRLFEFVVPFAMGKYNRQAIDIKAILYFWTNWWFLFFGG
jgi:hypothetical protein